MAVITISNTGGNWNSTATWVGGVIPTTSDSIAATATSGQLTVNVNASVQFLDLSLYTNTLTFNSGIVLQLTLASSTNTFGASMNFGGTGTLQLNAVASTWVQNTTNRIPNLNANGSVTRTLSTDMYVVNFVYTNTPIFNGNTIYISGNFYTLAGATTIGIAGTTNYYLDGSGIIGATIRTTMTITGDYNTFGQSLMLINNATLNYTSGATPTLFNVMTYNDFTTNETITINCSQPINFFLNNRAVNSLSPNTTINLTSMFMPNMIGVINESRIYTTDNTTTTFIFTGNSVSATTINMGPALRTTSLITNPPPAGSMTYQSPNLSFDPNYTHYIGSFQIVGGQPTNSIIRSSQSGVKVPINLGSKITSQIINYDFTDINASGGQQIVAINGTISNSDNITNVYPTGGGGGGGSFTFVN